MATVGSQVGIMPDTRTFTPTTELIASDVYIGYELEVEDLRAPPRNLSPLWQTKDDGSLRNGGAEYVFSSPLKGDDAIRALKELFGAIEKVPHDFSHRCGTHIHVDVRSMESAQLMSFITYCLMFERALFAYAGNKRDSNVFCLPYYKASHGLGGLGAFVRHGNPKYILSVAEKYYGINYKAIGRYGSVEFRMLPGTTDYNRVITWINAILAMHRAAVNGPKATDILQAMSKSGAKEFAADIFAAVPGFLPYVVVDDMYKGTRLAQEYIFEQQLSSAEPMLPKKFTQRSLISKFFAKNPKLGKVTSADGAVASAADRQAQLIRELAQMDINARAAPRHARVDINPEFVNEFLVNNPVREIEEDI